MPVPAPPSTVTIKTVSRHCLASPVGGDRGHLQKGTTSTDNFKLAIRPAVAPPLIALASPSVHILPTCSVGAVMTGDQTICCGSQEAGETYSISLHQQTERQVIISRSRPRLGGRGPGRCRNGAFLPGLSKSSFSANGQLRPKSTLQARTRQPHKHPSVLPPRGAFPPLPLPLPFPRLVFPFLLLLFCESPCLAIARPSRPPPGWVHLTYLFIYSSSV